MNRFTLFLGLMAATPVWAGVFDSARLDYEAGRFSEAVTALEKLADGNRSAEIQQALGAAWFKRGDLGRGIFHFRRAIQLRPRDADAKFNLDFSRKGAKDRLPTAGSWITLPFSESETWRLAAWLCLLTGVLGAVWVFRRVGWLSTSALAGSGLSVIVLALAVTATLSARPFGVVTDEEAKVFSGPGETYTHLFSLHAGAEFDRVGVSGPDWIQIHLADGKVGWLRTSLTVVQQ